MSLHTRFRGDTFGCDSACEERKHFTAEPNDRQTLLDRSIYIFHSRVQTAVSVSQENFETRWSLSHTKHHEKNSEGGRRGCGWGWGEAKGDWRQMLMYLAGLHACELLDAGVVTRHTSMFTRLQQQKPQRRRVAGATQFSCFGVINVILVELFEIKEAAGRLGPPDSVNSIKTAVDIGLDCTLLRHL